MMRRVFALFAFWLVCSCVAQAQAQVRAWLDRNPVAQGEAVALNIEADEAAAQPDLSPLRADFDIVDQSSSRQMQWANGAFSTKTLHAVSLVPKRSGRLQIPALRVGARTTPPLSVTVRAAATGADEAANTNADIFIETEVDEPNPYVQQAVGVTLRLYHAMNLTGQLDLDAPDGASLQRVGNDAQSVQTRNGRTYNVFERRYLLLPERSGALTLPAPRFAGNRVGGWMDDFFGGGGQALRARGTPRTLQVRAQPASAPQPWLPLRSLQLRYVTAPQQARAGEAATLIVEAIAVGAGRAQMPELPPPSVPGAQVFAEPAQYEETFRDGVPQVTVTRRYSIVPGGSGNLRIAGLRIAWWDVRAGVAKTATLPDLQLQVAPGTGGFAGRQLPSAPAAAAENVTAAEDASTQVPAHIWPWLAAGFAVLWLLTLIWAVWRRHEAIAPVSPAGGARIAAPSSTYTLADLKKALDSGTLDEVGDILRAMATPPAADYDALLDRLDDESQHNAIEALRRARWADGDGAAARSLLRAAFKLGPAWKAAIASEKEILPPLYPR